MSDEQISRRKFMVVGAVTLGGIAAATYDGKKTELIPPPRQPQKPEPPKGVRRPEPEPQQPEAGDVSDLALRVGAGVVLGAAVGAAAHRVVTSRSTEQPTRERKREQYRDFVDQKREEWWWNREREIREDQNRDSDRDR